MSNEPFKTLLAEYVEQAKEIERLKNLVKVLQDNIKTPKIDLSGANKAAVNNLVIGGTKTNIGGGIVPGWGVKQIDDSADWG